MYAEGKRKPLNEVTYKFLSCQSGAVGVVVSRPLSMREALGSIPRLSIVLPSVVCIDFGANTGSCMLRLHSVTSHNLLIMYIARSLQLDCARRFLHAEITWISVRLVKKPGLFPGTAMWSSREVCTSVLCCSITKKGELAIHHQCNSCIMNCCSLRLFKDTMYLSTVLAQDHFYSDTSAYTPVNRTPIIH